MKSLRYSWHIHNILEKVLQALETLGKLSSNTKTTSTGRDGWPQFWGEYHQVAKDYDKDFLAVHNTSLGSLLIFAGLFSGVNSTFIVQMQSSLSPNSADTTNELLKMLINAVNNGTSKASQDSFPLPTWTAPTQTNIIVQALAYSSLATSLLSAFGAVFPKQW
ncbi:hypothetical protein M422DRAFT_186643, partial [Sphaerobolus stellatus SS14]